jgi:hypothetical protein
VRGALSSQVLDLIDDGSVVELSEETAGIVAREAPIVTGAYMWCKAWYSGDISPLDGDISSVGGIKPGQHAQEPESLAR